MSEPICVKGPMHPDLFDGETPMMVPLEDDQLKLYTVEVRVAVIEAEVVEILASSEEEAEELGEEMAADMHFDGEVIDGTQVALSDNEVTQAHVNRYEKLKGTLQ